jgi:tetratricopeptide (TPR) repeat protein
MTYPYDLGRYARAVTTGSTDAQCWFDRGLNWIYGFNHKEAIACFTKAAAADPTCAMAHWGHAYAAGPNYNMPWVLYDSQGQAEALADAYDATQAALAQIDHAAPAEAALIHALSARYPQRNPIKDMAPWDRAFADAMRTVHRAHPTDPDIATAFVDALMNLTPWQMWDIEAGTIAPDAETIEAQAVLETQMALPGGMEHPGVLHLYVHLMEMSPYPEKAMKAADILRTLVPDAGHLVHMPTHIDVLCGAYENVVRWNERAIEADLKYYNAEGAFNIYTGYRQHNYHFVVSGALYMGQFEPAMRAVKGMRETTPDALLQIKSPPMADFFETILGMEPHVLIRFGMWEDILQLDLPADTETFAMCTAFIEYAKGLAFSALGHIEEADVQLDIFLAAKVRVPDSRLLHNVRGVDLLEVATAMLEGELAYRKGDYDVAFTHLRRAVALDDALPYDEPWGWMQPTRHALGALLFEQGQIEEAELAFRQDLGLVPGLPRACVHPDNVWALRGLYECLIARGDTAEAPHVKLRLDLAEARADRPVKAACGCAQVAIDATRAL